MPRNVFNPCLLQEFYGVIAGGVSKSSTGYLHYQTIRDCSCIIINPRAMSGDCLDGTRLKLTLLCSVANIGRAASFPWSGVSGHSPFFDTSAKLSRQSLEAIHVTRSMLQKFNVLLLYSHVAVVASSSTPLIVYAAPQTVVVYHFATSSVGYNEHRK
jgi:hypothetical protein